MDGVGIVPSARDVYRFIVLMPVIQVSQPARPFATLVRLQIADTCDMFIAEAFEARLNPLFKDLFAVLDQKLCLMLRFPPVRIENRQSSDQVIEATSESLEHLPNIDTKLGDRIRENITNSGPCSIEFRAHDCFLTLPKGFSSQFQVFQAFFGPC